MNNKEVIGIEEFTTITDVMKQALKVQRTKTLLGDCLQSALDRGEIK